MICELAIPVIVAPMAGGVSTPELVAEVVRAGGFGFVPGGYLSTQALADQIARTAELTGGRFGVNLFVPGPDVAPELAAYQHRVQEQADRYGVAAGQPRWEDDEYPAKLELVIAQRIPVVSFTFGLPDAEAVHRLHAAGAQVVATVTTPAEARQAVAAGADVLCVQGFEAGGHRGTLADDGVSPGGGEEFGLLALLRRVAATTDLPLIAAGGLVHGADVAAAISAGAVAAQLGTAFLLCPESGTSATHRAAVLAGTRRTAVTRAFTGRPARGLVNRFLTENGPHAPAAYPQVHHLTRPLRVASAKAGDPEAVHLWAGQTYPLAVQVPAAELVARLAGQARDALSRAADRFSPAG
ncbi:nitronate monooxygenase [Kutzneria viridogrisea]|uniref:Propionate 3-nitronate monooxygenase n=2 Tax=Kutzneria TaxID=43356 RepID=W5W1G4_9PSEU|nr:nitronate monooxygenase [Kutzneria albida]AHH95038.1 2-nitropropane dioxygenase [Kutzneria albida DSM 43870]MBA8927606.1 nitronate monooxygenase [Kutzneria viridogrisea]